MTKRIMLRGTDQRYRRALTADFGIWTLISLGACKSKRSQAKARFDKFELDRSCSQGLELPRRVGQDP